VSDKRKLLRSKILSDLSKGEFKIGSRLPGEGELVQRYGVSRATVRESIGMLVQEGVLHRRRGSGTYVESLQPRRKTKIVAAIVRCVREIWNSHARIVQAIEDKVHENGYSLILCNHDNNPDKVERYLDRLVQDEAAGVILSPIGLPGYGDFNLSVADRLEQATIPFVLIGTPVSADMVTRYTYVSSDGFSGSREIVRHLVQAGHRRIAYIRGFADDYTSMERFNGYCQEMRRCGFDVPENYVREIRIGPVESQGQQELRELMKLDPAPTAVLCVHDQLAKNVVEEAARMGLKVPQDLAVAGYGDDQIFTLTCEPALTTVRVPVAEEGARAVKLLFDKMNGVSIGEQQIFIGTQLIVRGSTVAQQEAKRC